MKIERDTDGWLMKPDGMQARFVPIEIVHALVRLGMEAQRERDAKLADKYGRQATADLLRRTLVTATDIEAAIGEGE